MAYSSPSTQVTGYVVSATDWNEFVNNFIAMAPDAFTADGDIYVASAVNVGTNLAAFTSSTGTLKHEKGGLEFDANAVTTNDGIGGASSGVLQIKTPVAQVEAEAGTNTRFSLWSSERVKQAIDALSSSTPVDIQEFTGSGTWTKPGGTPKLVKVIEIGGGGGGSGRRDTDSTREAGGGGGGGGMAVEGIFDPADLGATETVTIGAGGTGGADPGADNTDGNDGANGGTSSFGSLFSALGGTGGTGGDTTNGDGGNGAGVEVSSRRTNATGLQGADAGLHFDGKRADRGGGRRWQC